jgi:Ca2+-transporting ATPase
LINDYIFICITGIKDPLRPGIPESVDRLKKCGVTVRMVTGDNLGIYN